MKPLQKTTFSPASLRGEAYIIIPSLPSLEGRGLREGELKQGGGED